MAIAKQTNTKRLHMAGDPERHCRPGMRCTPECLNNLRDTAYRCPVTVYLHGCWPFNLDLRETNRQKTRVCTDMPRITRRVGKSTAR